jgi:phosphoribosyl-ATP pyrophosphohydrolase/phosphoribosyl-AMP cyclohydrolase
MNASFDPATLDYTKGGGLVTVVAQDAESGEVLMVAHADRAAIEETLASGLLHLRSRTRGPWLKGGTSGNTLRCVKLHADCDGDAVLALVVPAGPACHTGSRSCFGEVASDQLARLDALIAERARGTREAPSRTQRLLDDRNLRLKKLGEEATELAVACADGNAARAIDECADLIYHALVALRAAGGSWADVRRELAARSSR